MGIWWRKRKWRWKMSKMWNLHWKNSRWDLGKSVEKWRQIVEYSFWERNFWIWLFQNPIIPAYNDDAFPSTSTASQKPPEMVLPKEEEVRLQAFIRLIRPRFRMRDIEIKEEAEERNEILQVIFLHRIFSSYREAISLYRKSMVRRWRSERNLKNTKKIRRMIFSALKMRTFLKNLNKTYRGITAKSWSDDLRRGKCGSNAKRAGRFVRAVGYCNATRKRIWVSIWILTVIVSK